jgi:hypothetical protein
MTLQLISDSAREGHSWSVWLAMSTRAGGSVAVLDSDHDAGSSVLDVPMAQVAVGALVEQRAEEASVQAHQLQAQQLQAPSKKSGPVSCGLQGSRHGGSATGSSCSQHPAHHCAEGADECGAALGRQRQRRDQGQGQSTVDERQAE